MCDLPPPLDDVFTWDEVSQFINNDAADPITIEKRPYRGSTVQTDAAILDVLMPLGRAEVNAELRRRKYSKAICVVIRRDLKRVKNAASAKTCRVNRKKKSDKANETISALRAEIRRLKGLLANKTNHARM